MSKIARLLALLSFGLCLLALPVSAQEATPAVEPTAEVTVEPTSEAAAEITAAPIVPQMANPASAEAPDPQSLPGLNTLLRALMLIGGLLAILSVGVITMRDERKNRTEKQ